MWNTNHIRSMGFFGSSEAMARKKHKKSDELRPYRGTRLALVQIYGAERGRTYCRGSAEEERCRSLVKIRSMQRPSSTRTKGAVAMAAKLQWQMGARGRRCEWRMRRDLVGSIYKEKPIRWVRKTRRPKKHSYPATKAPRFSDGH